MFSDLTTTQLLDCNGRTTHTLTLEPDGTVTITWASSSRQVRVDPRNRRVLTPGASVPDELFAAACDLRPHG